MSQLLTLDVLLEQEREYRFNNLDFDFNSAWAIGNAIHQRASEANAPVAIEVFAFGQPLFLSALPGSSADNLEWMKRKRNTVLRLAHSSLFAGLNYEQSGTRMEHHTFINQAEYCDHGGSFPLLTKSGAVFGAVSVSGLPSEDDHALVIHGISDYLNSKK
ncbi:heme-degrading domain-containing protein [Rouxiella sp. WC2420]|uniref:Heme-degrading domain-containing protein n=1 Tax=Rouxiella sp. WC2420 TaxID=3234145 RepID=A0AB39VV31_9GAMM